MREKEEGERGLRVGVWRYRDLVVIEPTPNSGTFYLQLEYGTISLKKS